MTNKSPKPLARLKHSLWYIAHSAEIKSNRHWNATHRKHGRSYPIPAKS